MTRRLLPLGLAALAIACVVGSGSPAGRLIGVHDLVVVDDLPTNGAVASIPGADDAGNPLGVDPATTGIPGRYVFVTSADNNELKVLNLYVPGYVTRAWVPAPDPLSSLSIPVLDRPSMLAADEGLSPTLRRVTGPFVYAARAGGAQLSVVDATPQGFAQVTRSPLATPAPVTALAAWMGTGLVTLPDTTTLYYATWDGSQGSVYALTLPTARARRGEIKTARPAFVFDVGPEAIVTMQMVPPLPGRTLDGAPFCAGPASCLAVATRTQQGTTGRTVLVALDTLRTATLAYPAPVREFAVAGLGERLYALLDEEACGVGCSGAVAVDTRAGTSAGGFPVLKDFTGRPMVPIDVGGALPRGLTLGFADGGGAMYISRVLASDGGSGLSPYREVGMISSSQGNLYTFDGEQGMPIDFNADRSLLASAYLRVPLLADDGGVLSVDAGGGFVDYPAILTDVTQPVLPDGGPGDPSYRAYTLVPDAGPYAGLPPIPLSIGDGYLVTQTISVQRQGVVGPFNLLPVTIADDSAPLQVTFLPGLETLLEPGDVVAFGGYQVSDGTLKTCTKDAELPDAGLVDTGEPDEATITSLASGVARLDRLPGPKCRGDLLFTVFAGGTHPLTITGSTEGYLGRVGDGETFTYQKRYLVKPDGWDGLIRPALQVTLGSVPAPRNSQWVFGVRGNIERFHTAFDPTTVTCTPYVAGKLRLTPVSTYLSEVSTSFNWAVLTLFPAGNGVVYAPVFAPGSNSTLTLVERSLGYMSYNNGAVCFR